MSPMNFSNVEYFKNPDIAKGKKKISEKKKKKEKVERRTQEKMFY